ncbi:MAG: S24/S26 family peptidase [Prevotella sp.]|nr:S24/S26 family peptidase [Prevotella sp.]
MPHNTQQPSQLQFANAELIPEIVKMLKEGHTVTLRLRGFSMRPFLEDNRDKALLVKPSVVKVGDPVLCEIEPLHFVLHRIVNIEGDSITLRGDGNLATEHCRRDNIVASVIGFYRKGHERIDRTDGWKWRAYSFCWTRLFPLRRYILAAYRRLWIPLFGTA